MRFNALYTVLLIILFIGAPGIIQADIYDDDLTGAEYFFDLDPGEGSGFSLAASDDGFDEPFESIDQTITLPDLTSGPHYLYIRMRNAEGIWGIPNRHLIMVTNSMNAIIAAEYFYDTDPGSGDGYPLEVTDGLINTDLNLDISTLDVGMHRIYIRMQDAEGTWGPARQHTFEVTEWDGSGYISEAEYFVDTDPGIGAGASLSAADGSFNDPEEDFHGNLNTALLDEGLHTLYIRARDSDGNWTQPVASGGFEVTTPQTSYSLSTAVNGQGEVDSTPSGISCGSDCTEVYDVGTTVTLTATPDTGNNFTGWSGGGCSGAGDCVVTLTADTSVTANFSNTGSETIIDNGDPGTSFTGSWPTSSGPDYYGTRSVYSKTPGNTYSYETSLSGDYQLSLWWTQWSSRCTDVNVEIYDGSTLLDTVTVNQQENGGQWNPQGSYSFTGTAGVVIIAESTSCSTNADAVRFMSASPSALDHITIEGPTTVNENGTADYNARAYYTNGSNHLVEPVWSLTCPLSAEISAAGLLTTSDVAQDESCTVEASYEESGLVETAELHLTITDGVLPPAELIIDNGDPETSFTGDWLVSSGPDYYGTQSVWSKTLGGTYRYAVSLSGQYELSLWWTQWSSRCTNVTVEIYDGSNLIDTLTVNQQSNGGQWNLQGNYTFTGTGAVVIVSQGSSCSTNADAVRFVGGSSSVLQSIAIEGNAIVNENSTSDFNAVASFSDGSRSVEPVWSITCETIADISATGLLTSYDIDQDAMCTVEAFYQENDISRSDSFNITIHDLGSVTPTGMTILGPSTVSGSSSEQYLALVSLSDNSDLYVDPTWSVDCPSVASISSSGLLTTFDVAQPESCTINAAYTLNGGTVADYLAITVDVATAGIDFNQVETAGYSNQDRDGTVVVEDNGATLAFTGNRWVKTVQFYDITEETVIEFDFRSTIEGEIHGIGFDEDDELTNDKRIVQIFGTSAWTSAFQFEQYYEQNDLGSWVHFVIPVGQYYTGNNMSLVFVNDHDNPPANATGWFRDVKVSEGGSLPAELILDNGDPETSFTGEWPASGGPDYYGTQSVYSKTPGGTYRYEADLNGQYQLSLWWTEWSSRCTEVQVQIYDGPILIDTLTVNQRVNGGQWNLQGSYSFTGTGGVVIVSESSSCSTNADAVRLSEVP